MTALRQAVEAQFLANWSATSADRVDYGYNGHFSQPRDGQWVRLVVNPFGTENASIGTDHQRITGLVVVQCFTTEDSGDKETELLAEAVRAVYQNKTFDGVQCFATDVTGGVTSGGWYSVNANTPFQFDVFS